MSDRTKIPFSKKFYYSVLKIRYSIFGFKKVRAETSKAKVRRVRMGFFGKYCQGKGLDIGYGGDLLCKNCKGWERYHGDAHYLKKIKRPKFNFVYSSHTLEDLEYPEIALRNWWRVLKPGGYLILYVPHRDLYEKKKELPSRWNLFHKHFFLIDKDDPPNTLGIIPLIKRTLNNYKIMYAEKCDEGHTIEDPLIHSDGEYSIEVVVRKIKNSFNTYK